MVVALELEDLFTASVGARQAPGGLHGFGADAVEAQTLSTRHQTADGRRHLELELVLCRIDLAAVELRLDAFDKSREGVPKDQRTLTQHIVNVLILIDIP